PPLLRHEREHAPAAVVQHLDLDRATDLMPGENGDEIVRAGDDDAVERQNDVAGEEPCLLRRTPRLDAGDHHRTLLRKPGRMPSPPRERELLSGDADKGAPHPA